jgi:predicted ATPase/DNA-binding SARP family transcriptional activator
VAPLNLYLFGPPRVAQAGQMIDISLRKALALLVYLAVTRQPHSRDALATLFWPENNQREARASLRRTLYRLNEQLGADLLENLGETVAISAQVSLSLDIERFRQLVSQALARGEPRLAPGPVALEQAVAAAELYTDDFMAGFSLPNCPAFDDWQFFQREELRQLLARLLSALVESYQAAADYERAIAFARRWLALDPLHEPAHRQSMILYAAAGQHAAALRQYAECERILDEELGAPPEDETRTLYEAIRTKRFPPPVRLSVRNESQEPKGEAGKQVAQPAPVTPTPSPNVVAAVGPRRTTPAKPNLPAQTTPFVGREEELAEIITRLRNPDCRLLTLAGPGGVGKTRLALQVAQVLWETQDAAQEFGDGIFFVPLIVAQTSAEMAAALAGAIGLELYNDPPLLQQLTNYLRDRKILLVLDNFEHVQGGTEAAAELLAAAQGLKLLVTSREALNLTEEWFHPIAGLSFPMTDDPDQPIESYGAVRLFEQCAQRARIDFSLAAERDHVARICRLVDGMPLALELAAAWLKTLSAATIADEITHGIDILATHQRNVPERHRTMRAVLEQTWALLAPSEQAVLMRLSIFRSGFRRQAAAQVAGASLLTVSTLVDKSLVRATSSGRFQLHELLRQFAGEQLAALPETDEETRTRHSHFYLQYLAQQDEMLFGKQQQRALAEVAEEIDNIRMAWEWAFAQGDLEHLEQAIDPLYRFYWTRSRGREGAEIFDLALTWLKQSATLRHHPRYEYILRRLVVQRGQFYQFLGDSEACERDMLLGLMLARKLGLKEQIAPALNTLGVLAAWQGHWALAQERLRESRALFLETGNPHGVADSLHEEGLLHLHFGLFEEGKRLIEESLTISRTLERPDWTAWAHDGLGWTCFLLGEYETARTHYETSLALFERIGHERGMALGFGGLGMLAWAQGQEQLAEARGLAERSLALIRKIGYRLHTASRLSMLALILNDLHEYDTAHTHAQEGLVLASEVGSPLFIAYNLFALAETAYRQADFVGGRRYLRELVTITHQMGLLPSLAIALYHAGALLALEVAPNPNSDTNPDAVLGTAEPQLVRAIQLLALVADHPAGWCAYRTRAQQLLGEVAARLPTELATTAQAQGRLLDLRTTAEELVQAL